MFSSVQIPTPVLEGLNMYQKDLSNNSQAEIHLSIDGYGTLKWKFVYFSLIY